MTYVLSMIIGHFVGDYIFQTSKMAERKNKPGKNGWKWAFIHSFVYSVTLISFMVFAHPELLQKPIIIYFWIFTLVTHAIIDHYSLAKKWSNLVKSDTLPDFSQQEVCEVTKERTVSEIYKASFNSFVYIAIDNTWHIVLQASFLILAFR